VSNGFFVISQEIVEAHSETSGLLREEIGVILNKSNFLTNGQKFVGQLFGNYFFKATVIETEAGSQEVWLEETDEVLTVQGVVSLLASDHELTIFGLPLSKQIPMIRMLHGSILLLFWLNIALRCKLLPFLN